MLNSNNISKVWREVPCLARKCPDVIAGLDLGTSKTVAVIAQIEGGCCPEVIGAGTCLGLGLRRGVIADNDSAAKSISQAIEKAERLAGIKISSAYVSYNGSDIALKDCPGEAAVVEAGVKTLHNVKVPWPTGPADCFGTSTIRSITARDSSMSNIIRSAKLAGVVVEGIVYGPLAASEVLLSHSEREFGSLLIDVGAGTTTISAFSKGILRDTVVIPVGGEHLSGDLAIGLRTTLAQAEDIIKAYNDQRQDGSITVVSDAGSGDGKCFSANIIKRIIDARLTEITELIASKARGLSYYGMLPGNAVLYGGVARLKGLSCMAETRLGLPVRVGQLKNTWLELDHTYANAVGLVTYAYVHGFKKAMSRRPRFRKNTVADKFIKLFNRGHR